MDIERPIVIIGAGGHGKVVAEALLRCDLTVKGFADKTLAEGHIVHEGLKVLGTDSIIGTWASDAVSLANGLGLLPGNSRRRKLFEKFSAKGYEFITVVHPSAVCAGDISLAEGAQIMAGALLQPGVLVGKNTVINTSASIDHDCRVGQHCHIAPGVTLSGGVEVGDNVLIGAGATVIQYLRIGDNAVIGAGAVVLNDVPAGQTVVGCPAGPLKR